MAASVTPEQQAALQALGVTASEYVFYHAGRIDGRYLTHAMACLLVYDFLLTLGEEVEFIWKTKPTVSVAKGLWFLNRYWPLIGGCMRIWAMAYATPPAIVCNVAIQFTAWSGLINIAIVDILLMLRVWALYNGSRKVKWFLIGVFVVGLPTAIGLRQAPPVAGIPLVTPAPRSLTVCKRSPPTELFSLFTMALLIDTIIFAMVIYRAGGRQFRSQAPMLAVLVRDGALYYAAITAVLAFMIAATFIPAFYQPVADANLNVPLSSLACNRLILSLRGVYFKGSDGGTRTDRPTITSYNANNGPPPSTRVDDDIHLGALRSPTSAKDFRLAGLRSPKRQSDLQIRSMDSDWDRETYKTSPEIESVLSHGSQSRGRSLMDVLPGRHTPTSATTPSMPLISQVTVSVTKSAVADDGVEFKLPVEDEESRAMSPEQERSRSVDWWDSRDGAKGTIAQSAGASPNFSRPGVYESRVGYRHDRIPEESEPLYGTPRSPLSV